MRESNQVHIGQRVMSLPTELWELFDNETFFGFLSPNLRPNVPSDQMRPIFTSLLVTPPKS